MKKPNIVFIMADQLGASYLGCYGSGVPSTPTLDRLAGEGVRFTRNYCSTAMCAPNRATLITGRSPSAHGIVHNNLELRPDTPTYVRLLREEGYRTGGFGKFHHTSMECPPPTEMHALGFDEIIETEDSKLGPWLDWVEKEHPEHYEKALAVSWPMPYMRHYGPDKKDIYPAWQAAHEKYRAPLLKLHRWQSYYPSPLPQELHQTTFITDRAQDFLNRCLDAPGGDPFYCQVSYVDPHEPYDPPAPYDTMYAPGDMPLPLPGSWEQRGCKTLAACHNFHGFGAIAHDPAQLQKVRAYYHGSIRFLDDQIARLVQLLRDRGALDHTIIVFTTDHGDMMGDHHLIAKGPAHYDNSIRCPLLVRGPGIAPAVCDRLTCSLDFFPTLCDWAGVPAAARQSIEGKSFAGVCIGQSETDPWRQVTVQNICYEPSAATGAGLGAQGLVQTIITDDGYRLSVFDEEGYGELFNLTADPHEQHNLYDDPAHAGRQRSLLERHIRAHMRLHKFQHPRNYPWRPNIGRTGPMDGYFYLDKAF